MLYIHIIVLLNFNAIWKKLALCHRIRTYLFIKTLSDSSYWLPGNKSHPCKRNLQHLQRVHLFVDHVFSGHASLRRISSIERRFPRGVLTRDALLKL